jgi:2'-5' RNA ligase
MRVFIALDIAGPIRQSITEYVNRVRGLAPDARWAKPESLHVTLKFIGEASDTRVQEIKNALATVQTAPFATKFQDVGFFPNPKSPRVFWIGMSTGEALPQLAVAVDAALVKVGIAREEKPYRPHLTLARASSGPDAKHQLQPLVHAEAPPQFGTMMAREFWLYRSEPQRGGSRYTKLERFGLE